mgnify:CR=1 FL=1
MVDSLENSNLREIIKNSFIQIDYEGSSTQNQDISCSQNEESKSRQFYGDYIEQSSQSIAKKEIQSTEKDNCHNGNPFGQEFKIDTEPIEQNSNVHFFCKNCHQVPVIKFVDVLNIIFSCGCYKNCKINITKFLDDTLLNAEDKEEINDQENNILLDVFYCKMHKGQKFYYYCDMCNASLCRKCLRKEKDHKDHCPLIFDLLMNEADEKIEFIKDKFYLNSHHFDNESSNFLDDDLDKMIKYSNFIKFINALINDYNNYTCYSHFIIINNLYQFLENYNKNNNSETQALELKEEINIKNINNLKNINSNSFLITSINLNNCNIFDIQQFCDANLINLKTLNLSNNYISNIKPLISAKFKNIENLDFSINKIGDDNIQYFSQLEFKNLKFLNLFGNNFTDYKLFELCNNKKLKNLKKLYTGCNQFKNSEVNTTFDSSNIEEIGLTYGVFNNETIHFIHKFKFNNLKKLFLHSNKLSSLSFIEDLELPNIKEIWINNNLLEDYYPLCKYKTLNIINIRKNCIKNIDNLISFIDEFTQLKEIDMKENCIDFNDNKNESLISDAKKKLELINYF